MRIENLVCLDVGSSTGGFVDCLLQNGASRVYAVDTAYGELAWKLRQDPRVVVMEKADLITIDSLLALPARPKLKSEGGKRQSANLTKD